MRLAVGEGQQCVAGDQVRVPFQPTSVPVRPRTVRLLTFGKFGDEFSSPVVRSPLLVDQQVLTDRIQSLGEIEE